MEHLRWMKCDNEGFSTEKLVQQYVEANPALPSLHAKVNSSSR